MNLKSISLFATAMVIGMGVVWFGSAIFARPYTFQGSLIDPPIEMDDFLLYDQRGAPFRLKDQKGQIVLLFFGYSFCPDVCPSTLAEYKEIHDRLGDQATRVRFVFVTVDPERDTPERIGQYVDQFDPSFIGLSGPIENLETAWGNFFVYRSIPGHQEGQDYLVEHTSRVYAIDAAGKLRMTYPFGMDTEAYVGDILHLLDGN